MAVVCLGGGFYALPAHADQRIQGDCSVGGVQVNTTGTLSTTEVQSSSPGCTVQVFNTGTIVNATLYSDNSRTPLANPLTANASTGHWSFYVASGSRVDIQMTGGTPALPSTVTLGDVLAYDPASGAVGAVCPIAFSATPAFTPASCGVFTMTLTGDVTGATISGSLTGQTNTYSLCQDATGGRTFTWPASFLRPPVPSPVPSACSTFTFWYDGTNWRHVASGDSSQFSKLNDIQYVNSTTSITTAYAALPSTGGTVELASDITISSATTLTLTAGKPLLLNLKGHTITCSALANSSICLKIIKPDATPRYRLEIAGGSGTLTWSGTGTSIVGLQFGDPSSPAVLTDVYVHDLTIKSFNTTSSIGLKVDWVEEFDFEHLTFASNTQGAQISSTTTITTIQNRFCNSTFQENVTAAILQDISELTFCDNTVQSNTAQKAFIIKTSAGNDSSIRISRNHFENNGDTTNASRQISMQPAAGKSITRVVLEHNVFNGGANFPGGATNVEATGAAADIGGVRFAYNIYNSGSACTGIPTGRGFTSEYDACNVDVNINPNTPATPFGITFAPVGAAKAWQIYGGFPAQFDGDLVFRDLTAAANILVFGSSTWNFQANVITTTGNITGNKITTGASGLSINAGTALTGQTGTGTSVVTNNGPTITGTSTLGRIAAVGTVSTCSVTGAGATGSCAIATGSTDSFGEMSITVAGAGPAALGTATLTFSSSFGANAGVCVFMLQEGGNAWNARASLIGATRSQTTFVVNWDNNAIALSAGTYLLEYVCGGR